MDVVCEDKFLDDPETGPVASEEVGEEGLPAWMFLCLKVFPGVSSLSDAVLNGVCEGDCL